MSRHPIGKQAAFDRADAAAERAAVAIYRQFEKLLDRDTTYVAQAYTIRMALMALVTEPHDLAKLLHDHVAYGDPQIIALAEMLRDLCDGYR